MSDKELKFNLPVSWLTGMVAMRWDAKLAAAFRSTEEPATRRREKVKVAVTTCRFLDRRIDYDYLYCVCMFGHHVVRTSATFFPLLAPMLDTSAASIWRRSRTRGQLISECLKHSPLRLYTNYDDHPFLSQGALGGFSFYKYMIYEPCRKKVEFRVDSTSSTLLHRTQTGTQ